MGLAVEELNLDLAGRRHAEGESPEPCPRPVDILLAEKPRLLRIAAGMGVGPATAEDVFQDVSVKVIEKGPSFPSRQDCIRWLVKVTVNRCLVEHRRRRTFLGLAAKILKRRRQAQQSAAVTHAAAAEELALVRQGLADLDGPLLAPLVLRYFCDLDATEIGRILGLKPSTVRSRLREARLSLARTLTKKGIER